MALGATCAGRSLFPGLTPGGGSLLLRPGARPFYPGGRNERKAQKTGTRAEQQ